MKNIGGLDHYARPEMCLAFIMIMIKEVAGGIETLASALFRLVGLPFVTVRGCVSPHAPMLF